MLIYHKAIKKKRERDCRNLQGTQEVSWICFPLSLFLKSRCQILMEKMCQLLSPVWLFETPWTVVRQATLSMGCSRQESWSGLSCPPLGDLPDPGIEPRSPALQADSLPSEPPGKPAVYRQLSKYLLREFPNKSRYVSIYMWWSLLHFSMGFEMNKWSRNIDSMDVNLSKL